MAARKGKHMEEFIIKIIFFIPAILIALIVHEYAHAKMAYNLGDPTAKYSGRLTLNPLVHLDPFGTLLLIATFLFGGVCIGWAKPVPINPYNFRDYFKDSMLVGLAGPLSNFAMAALAGLFFRFNLFVVDIIPLRFFLLIFIQVNIGLGLFNLLPVPPLDGSRILMGILPKDLAWKFNEFEARAPMAVFIILILLLSTGILSAIILPPFKFLFNLFTGA